MSAREWWADQWPEGQVYVAGLVAQDVQDGLFETVGRWPLCLGCPGPEHSLYIQPDLGGPDPVWVCEVSGDVVAPWAAWATEPAAWSVERAPVFRGRSPRAPRSASRAVATRQRAPRATAAASAASVATDWGPKLARETAGPGGSRG